MVGGRDLAGLLYETSLYGLLHPVTTIDAEIIRQIKQVTNNAQCNMN